MVQEPLVHLANAYAHLDISVMQMITEKAVIYVGNVKLTMIVRVLKFASNSVGVFVIALMRAVNSHVDQMHIAALAYILLHL